MTCCGRFPSSFFVEIGRLKLSQRQARFPKIIWFQYEIAVSFGSGCLSSSRGCICVNSLKATIDFTWEKGEWYYMCLSAKEGIIVDNFVIDFSILLIKKVSAFFSYILTPI